MKAPHDILRPMESAPKTGEWIYAEGPDGVRYRVHWAAGYVDDYQPAVSPGWYYEAHFADGHCFYMLQNPKGWLPA